MQPEPIFLMLKPPSAIARMIAGARPGLGISDGYAAEPASPAANQSVPPGGSSRPSQSGMIVTCKRIEGQPFPITLDTLQGNMLMVGRGANEIVTLRREVQQLLARKGLPLQFNNKPHMSLAYGGPREGRTRFGPVGWTVEEILLVRSLYGRGRHIEEGRITLAPRQGDLFH